MSQKTSHGNTWLSLRSEAYEAALEPQDLRCGALELSPGQDIAVAPIAIHKVAVEGEAAPDIKREPLETSRNRSALGVRRQVNGVAERHLGMYSKSLEKHLRNTC